MASSTTSLGSTTATTTYAALTTTFTPPSQCSPGYLTMLSSPGYQIWLNEPVPVSGSTVSSCYPSEWLDGYTTASDSSIVPAMSPLICPYAWTTVLTSSHDYIACCPPSYTIALPTLGTNSLRPAYGGTCYSDLSMGRSVLVTEYDSADIMGTITFTASTSGAQAYAHLMDGYAMQQAVSISSSTSTTSNSQATPSYSPTVATPSATATPTSSTSVTPQPVSQLSGGSIAGIVIGAVAAVALAAALAWYLLRRRRRPAAHELSDEPRFEVSACESDKKNVYTELETPPPQTARSHYAEMGEPEPPRYEMDAVRLVELDALENSNNDNRPSHHQGHGV